MPPRRRRTRPEAVTPHTDWDYIRKVPRAALKAHIAHLDELDKASEACAGARVTGAVAAVPSKGTDGPQHTGAQFTLF